MLAVTFVVYAIAVVVAVSTVMAMPTVGGRCERGSVGCAVTWGDEKAVMAAAIGMAAR